MKKILLILPLLFLLGCEEEKAEPPSLPEDCAGVIGGINICGCTDSTAINYDSNATFDDGSCEYDTLAPNPATLLVARYIPTYVKIRWASNFDDDFLSYVLKRSDISTESGFVQVAEIFDQGQVDYSDTDIEKDRRYYYKVVKSDSSNNESESNVVTASSYAKFSFYVNNTGKVYTIDSDGQNTKEIVKMSINSGHLWSPEKSRILLDFGSFFRLGDYTNIIDWDNLTSFPEQTNGTWGIHWSTIEDRIFFWDGYEDYSHWVNVDGTNMVEFPQPGPYDYIHPSVNTVNDNVAYIRYWSTDKGLTVTDPSGNVIWQLTSGRNPYWSRSGARILFCDYNDADVWNLFVINADQSGLTQLTDYQPNSSEWVVATPEYTHHWGQSVWSPDDMYVLYRLNNSGQVMIRDMVDGTDYNYTTGSFPIWLEDNYLASFQNSGENENRELFISNVGGSFEESFLIPDSLTNPSELHFIPN